MYQPVIGQQLHLRFQRIPGRKPGTSTKVMIGMLNASQKRTNRAPFTEELMSKQPEIRATLKYTRKKRKAHSERWQSFSLLTRSHFRLVAHNANSASVHPGKSHHNVFGVVRHDLKKVPLVHNLNRQNWRNWSHFQRLDESCKFAHVPRERCPTCRTLLLTPRGRWCPANAPGDH